MVFSHKNKDSETHPDNFMLVEIGLRFAAKKNPERKDVPDIDSLDYGICLPADEETAEYLEAIAEAIRDRRLYGFMQQEGASCHTDGKEWIEENDVNIKFKADIFKADIKVKAESE